MDVVVISLPDGDTITCGCRCHGRVGNVLNAVVASVAQCPTYTLSGINGVYNALTWDETNENWTEPSGTINGEQATAVVSCGANVPDAPCETWQLDVIVLSGPLTGVRAFHAVMVGDGCSPLTTQMGTPIPNLQTDCDDNPAVFAGIAGTFTLDTP